VKDALDKQRDAQEKLTAAQQPDPKLQDAILQAKKDLTGATKDLATAQGEVLTKELTSIEMSGKLADAAKNDYAVVSGLVGQYRAIEALHPELVSVIDPVLALLGPVGAKSIDNTDVIKVGKPHASGGPVSAGTAYMVGENGPEMFMPGSGGTIIPNGAGGAITINVNGATFLNEQAARELATTLAPHVTSAVNQQARRGTNQTRANRLTN
jgi:hypothetical protein